MHVTNLIDNNAVVTRVLTRINVSDPQICKSSNSTLRKARRYTISVLRKTTKSLRIVHGRTCTEFWVKVMIVFDLRYKRWRTKCHAFQCENALRSTRSWDETKISLHVSTNNNFPHVWMNSLCCNRLQLYESFIFKKRSHNISRGILQTQSYKYLAHLL